MKHEEDTMRPLPPKYPLADVVDYGVAIVSAGGLIIMLNDLWRSFGIELRFLHFRLFNTFGSQGL